MNERGYWMKDKLNDKTKGTNRKKGSKKMDELEISPQDYIIEVLAGLRDHDPIKYQAAKDLLPYYLPKLQSVEAKNVNVNMTHEEALQQLMDEDDDED